MHWKYWLLKKEERSVDKVQSDWKANCNKFHITTSLLYLTSKKNELNKKDLVWLFVKVSEFDIKASKCKINAFLMFLLQTHWSTLLLSLSLSLSLSHTHTHTHTLLCWLGLLSILTASQQKSKTSTPVCPLGMTLNWIWWWGSSSGALTNVD